MTTLTLRTSFAGLMGAGILLFLSACASDPAPTSPQPIPERRFEISPASAGRVPPQVVEDGSSGPLFVQLRTFDPGGGPVHAAFPEWSHPDGEVYLQVAFEPEPHASSWTPMLAKLRWHTEVNGRALNPHEVFENLPISFYPAGRI
ncbi:MAG: hypothetical protein KDA25_10405, partial [Phycisphaerales bacterium]|nr:hypothetical protein [Phycisphaerales bacterium]